MGSVVTTDLPVAAYWISEAIPLRIASDRYQELRVHDRALVLRDWFDSDTTFLDRDEVFADGPAVAVVLVSATQPTRAALAGQEGGELLRLEFEPPGWTRLAELPRFRDDVGGMRNLEVLPRDGLVLLHWELGILAVDEQLDLLWRQDLDWNHRMIHLDGDEVWFDMMYESEEIPQRIGERPWGFATADGRELFDRKPPTTAG